MKWKRSKQELEKAIKRIILACKEKDLWEMMHREIVNGEMVNRAKPMTKEELVLGWCRSLLETFHQQHPESKNYCFNLNAITNDILHDEIGFK